MARPGYFFIDTKGVIREKFFEAKYRQRFSGNNVIGKLFPALGDEVTDNVEAPHLSLAVEQSDRTGFPGGRITLTAEVQLPPDVHVYAPGVQGYKSIALVMDPTPGMEFTPVNYPRAKVLYLPAIKERVPCIRGEVPHHSGAENKLRRGVQQFARDGRKNVHDCGKARISGLR